MSSQAERINRVLTRICIAVGATGLLIAMATDFTGVIARALGLQLVGTIEIIQLCITVTISAAVVMTTLQGAHASVHLFTTRMQPRLRQRLAVVASLATVLGFAVMAVGNSWIFVELLPQHEQGDLLKLPIAPTRGLWCFSLALAAMLAAAQAIAGLRNTPKEDTHEP